MAEFSRSTMPEMTYPAGVSVWGRRRSGETVDPSNFVLLGIGVPGHSGGRGEYIWIFHVRIDRLNILPS